MNVLDLKNKGNCHKANDNIGEKLSRKTLTRRHLVKPYGLREFRN